MGEFLKYFWKNQDKNVEEIYKELKIKIEEMKANEIEKKIYQFLKEEVFKND